jgi:hypothetical protein
MTAARTSAAAPTAGHGLTQHERHVGALDPRSAPVDERQPAYFLAFATEYARLLQFHELDGRESGDWRLFFDVDISFLLAEISCVRVQDEAFEGSALLRRLEWRGGAALQDVIDFGYMMLARVQRWHRRALAAGNADLSVRLALPPSDEQTILTMFLEKLIRTKLRFLVDAVLATPASRECWLEAARRAGADPGTANDAEGTPWYEADCWKMEEGDAALTLEDLPRAFNELYTLSGDLQQLATASLARTLGDVERHPPHATLYLAFVKLLGHLQADVNRFTERHLDYYYRTILQLHERAAQPDGGYVMLRLVPDCPGYYLPRGSLLSAGKDGAGTDILFTTDKDIDVNQASIGALRTLYFARRPESHWIERALAAPVAASEDGLGLPLAHPERGWPAFGRRAHQPGIDDSAVQARFGFLLMSPVLLLTQGKRHIQLSFEFDRASMAALSGEIQDQFKAANRAAAVPSWRSVLRDGLRVAVSGAKGWTEVPRFFFRSRSADAATCKVDLVFTLAADLPAVLANPGLDGAAGSSWPGVRITLNPNAGLYLYSAFARAVLARVDITVDVRGLDNVELSGPIGPMSAAKPFPPFGSLGECGGYFDLYHPELGKQLQQMSIELAWQNLPASVGAFQDYYDGYQPVRDASQLSVQVARHSGRRWLPVAGQDSATFALFATRAASTPLARTRLCFVPPRFTPPEAAASAAPPGSDGAPPAGTLRVALAAPADGFGHALYQRAFTDRALRNAAHVFAKDPATSFEPSINVPIIPMAASIRCNYVASDSIVPGAVERGPDKFRYLQPFGAAAVQPDCRATLLADDGYDGHLYIGLAGVRAAQVVELHFQLRERSAAQYTLSNRPGAAAAPQPDAIAWRYLAGSVWCEFDAHGVISATADLSRSGIISFRLPGSAPDQHGAMPANLFWIEARARGVALDSLMVGVMAQAVAVTRRMNGSTGPLSLAPKSIHGLHQKVAVISALVQPYATTGGSAAESAAQLRVRASERLRHKGRACQPADYEQLLLDAFEGIRQAKCFGHNDGGDAAPGGRVARGAIGVVLVPASARGAEPAPLPLHRLQQAAEYLRDYVSALVRAITLRNCEYEYLKVCVAVEFKPGCDPQASITKLNTAISDSLAPWLADPACALELGCATVYGHRVAELIRKQPYVSEVGPVQLAHRRPAARGNRLAWIAESGCARLSTPWSVFMPDPPHAIRVGSAAAWPAGGIGKLVVDGDFVIAPDVARRAGVDGATPAPAPSFFLSIPSMRAPPRDPTEDRT